MTIDDMKFDFTNKMQYNAWLIFYGTRSRARFSKFPKSFRTRRAGEKSQNLTDDYRAVLFTYF